MSNSVNLFGFIGVANIQHRSVCVNLCVGLGLLLDRILVSSVQHATVRTLKPKNLKPLLKT